MKSTSHYSEEDTADQTGRRNRMTDTTERIEAISEAIGYPKKHGHAFTFMELNGVEDFEHVLISRMEEEIESFQSEKSGDSWKFGWWQKNGRTFYTKKRKSRLEATFAAWQAIKEQQQ